MNKLTHDSKLTMKQNLLAQIRKQRRHVIREHPKLTLALSDLHCSQTKNNNLRSHSSTPVSYTHLDVYKRQIIRQHPLVNWQL